MKNLLDSGLKSSMAARYNITRNIGRGKPCFFPALGYN